MKLNIIDVVRYITIHRIICSFDNARLRISPSIRDEQIIAFIQNNRNLFFSALKYQICVIELEQEAAKLDKGESNQEAYEAAYIDMGKKERMLQSLGVVNQEVQEILNIIQISESDHC